MPATLTRSTTFRRFGLALCAAGFAMDVLGWVHAYNAPTVAATLVGTRTMSVGSLLAFVGLALTQKHKKM